MTREEVDRPVSPARMSLLEIALHHTTKSRHYGKCSPQEIELALAWCGEVVGFAQVRSALGGVGSSAAYSRLALCLRQAMKQGLLFVAKETPDGPWRSDAAI